MDESILFNGVMRALLGGRRRRGRRAMGYIGSAGSALLSHPAALMTAAGVAWGIFETLQGQGQGQMATGGAGLGTSGAGLDTSGGGPGGSPVAASMPPLPRLRNAQSSAFCRYRAVQNRSASGSRPGGLPYRAPPLSREPDSRWSKMRSAPALNSPLEPVRCSPRLRTAPRSQRPQECANEALPSFSGLLYL